MATDWSGGTAVMESYDPNVIIQAADEKLSNNDLEGGVMIFKAALLNWVDDAREAALGNISIYVDQESLQEGIATLWIAYAQYFSKAKQFKSATEVFEQAVDCPIASQVGRVWLEYARFAEERGRVKTAQDIYIRALVGDGDTIAVKDEQDQNVLWGEFLEMMQNSRPELTLEELKSVVKSNPVPKPEKQASPPSPPSNTESSPPMKRAKVEEQQVISDPSLEKNYAVTAEAVDVEAKAFGEGLAHQAVPPDLAAAWMIRDGNGPAQPPEPPLFQPSPPKFSDPTAKDILGIHVALQVIAHVLSPTGNLLLEVCRGLWALQALKEKQAVQATEMLDNTMKAEMEKLETNLAARLSVAGEASAGVQVLNQNQRREFQANCGQQRQHILTGIAWEFRQLLCLQQQILTKMKVPSFDGPTVDPASLDLQARVCSYLHSAFYLRTRVGEAPHVNMLKGHLKALQKEQEAGRTTSPVPPSSFALQQPPPPNFGYPAPPQQMPMMMGMPYPGQMSVMMGAGQPQQMPNQQIGLPPPPPPPGMYGNNQYPPPPPSYYH